MGRPTLVRTACSTDSSTTAVVEYLDAEVLARVKQMLSVRYGDVSALGEGGFGVVVRAYDKLLKRSVAIKCFTSEVAGAEQRRLRSQNEHYITAGLRHPGIVAVHDRDPREHCRWFAMEHVEGLTLRQRMSAIVMDDTVDDNVATHDNGVWKVLRLVHRAANIIAHAHSQGVAHLDVKPENIMASNGRSYVLDWGLARNFAAERAAASDSLTVITRGVWGTFMYMSPEQAGAEGGEVSLRSDVFALGLLIYEAAHGQPAYNVSKSYLLSAARAGRPPAFDQILGATDISPSLKDIYQKATAYAAAERYQDAGELAGELKKWFVAQERRVSSNVYFQKAEEQQKAVERCDALIERACVRAQELARGVQSYDDVEKKAPLWQQQDQVVMQRIALARLRAERLEMLLGAIAIDPSSPAARQSLFEHHARDYEEAERAGNRFEMARYEALMEKQAPKAARDFIGRGAVLSLTTVPAGAKVNCRRYETGLRRLILDSKDECLGVTPISEHMLSAGSYLLRIDHPDCEPVFYPICIQRNKPCTGHRPGDYQPHPIMLPSKGSLQPDDCYVPAGWCRIGGDPQARDGLPALDIWVDGFVIKRAPVTRAEYGAFIDALMRDGFEEEGKRYAPKERATMHPHHALAQSDRGPDSSGQQDGLLPVVAITLGGAVAYCRWRSKLDGIAWRLPHGVEREKATRGMDGRLYSWGFDYDPAFTWALETQQDYSSPATVDAYRCDISPYGVTSLCGNTRDLCHNEWRRNGPILERGLLDIGDLPNMTDPTVRATVRGGSWESVGWTARAASRFALRTDDLRYNVGFRLARSWPPCEQA